MTQCVWVNDSHLQPQNNGMCFRLSVPILGVLMNPLSSSLVVTFGKAIHSIVLDAKKDDHLSPDKCISHPLDTANYRSLILCQWYVLHGMRKWTCSMMCPDRPVRSREEQYTRSALNSGSGGACGQALAEHLHVF
jgi:hypothetical protein